MNESKCAVMPSGSVSFHVWETGAKSGDRCKCGERVLDGLSDDSAKLLEIQEVLKWASDNVVFARFVGDPHNVWFVDLGIFHTVRYHGRTLYEALYSAWKERNKEST